MRVRWILLGALALAACGNNAANTGSGSARFQGQAWADNWFAMYLGDRLIAQDSVPITTERSFNAETFTFDASYPLALSFVIKDYKQNDSGLEYIGLPNQQMGDGGFIFQLTDQQRGEVVHASSAAWRCTVIHKAPLNKTCEKDAQPERTCLSQIDPEPAGWKDPAFDDSGWSPATEYSSAAVGPKDGYFQIPWVPAAWLIWTSDLQMDNTLLCRARVAAP